MTITYGMIFRGNFQDLASYIVPIEKGFISMERIKQYIDMEGENINEIKNSHITNKEAAKSFK